MSLKNAGYIGAIESLIEVQKVNLALCTAPLALMIAQIRWIQSLDTLTVKVAVTIAVVCLLCASALVVYFLDLSRHYLAITKLRSDSEYRPGSPYLAYLLKLYDKNELTEERITELAERLTNPIAYFIIAGWCGLVIALIFAIWSTP